MSGLGVMLFATLILSGLISAQIVPPFKLNALLFNISTDVSEGSEVYLRCEYLLVPPPSCRFEMILSFVQEEKLTESGRAVASSIEFLFPEALKKAHKISGSVLNKTIYTPGERGGSVSITTSFLSSTENEGSYICQMIPINLDSKGDWTLTRWMHLKNRKKPIPTSLWTLIFCGAALKIFLILICCCCYAMRPQRMIFKRVDIDDSRISTTSSHLVDLNEGQVNYQPPKITMISAKRPCFLLYQLDLYRQREFRRSYRQGICALMPEGEDAPHEAKSSSIIKRLDSPHHVHFHFLMPFDPFFEIPLSFLHIERPLGQGAFGFVFQGSAVKLPGGIVGPVPVAIKTPGGDATGSLIGPTSAPENSSEADVVAFVQEIEMMKFIGKHENVIQLYATSSYNGRPVIVMEYAAKGSLANYLHKNHQSLATQSRSLTVSCFFRFAQQIANGMAYLASKGIVHRDLATRNVVLSKNWVAKVADFGLTRKVEFYYRMHGSGPVPLKWMAPESVFQKLFTSKSDVWSFGVLLWELFSLGESPASDVTNSDFLRALRKGQLLFPQPEFADDSLYKALMQRCWSLQPECRPSFCEIGNILSSYCSS
ncbi:hypothetical protein Aperf_G00000006859 [Anoplocephala perfoliata]